MLGLKPTWPRLPLFTLPNSSRSLILLKIIALVFNLLVYVI